MWKLVHCQCSVWISIAIQGVNVKNVLMKFISCSIVWHSPSMSEEVGDGWQCTVEPMVRKAVFVCQVWGRLKAWKVYAMNIMKIDSSQKVCWVFQPKSTCKAGTQKKFFLLPGTLDVSQFPGQMVENCWHFCLLVENNLLANQCILAARPGFMSRKKTQIIGQPVTLGLAGFHYSVLHSGT